MTNNVSGTATKFNTVNYLGELVTIGQNKTPFLSLLGAQALTRGIKSVAGWEFPLNSNDELEAASQPAITETGSLTAPTAKTYVRSQETNVVQIFQKSVDISYAALSNRNNVSGVALNGEKLPVADEQVYQLNKNIMQIAKDANYTFLNGVYNKATASNEAYKTRGISTAISTNTVAASSAALSTSLIDSIVKKLADSGAPMDNMFCFVNSTQKQKLSSLYGFQPDSRVEGGVNIQKILTDFCEINVVYEPSVTASELLIVDMDKVDAVGLEVPGKGSFFYEELAKSGASEKGQLYGQLGIAYGHESFHAKITGLATA